MFTIMMLKALAKTIVKNGAWTISALYCEFPDITRDSLRDYHSWNMLSQVLRRMVSENAHGCSQNSEIGIDLLV
jgi:hypothetical protein